MNGFGVGIPHQLAATDAGYYGRALGALWPTLWHNWLADQYDTIYPAYIPEVWAMRINDFAWAAARLSHNGPRLWWLGNEPNKDDQSDTDPETAAMMSAWWWATAAGTFGAPGLIVMEPDSLDAVGWLTRYLNAGGLLGECLTVDNYAWTPDQWDNNLRPVRKLLAGRGIELPVDVRECACYDASLEAQMRLMDHIAQRIEDGTVQRACWYSARDPFGPFRAADLLDEAGQLTPLGAHYRQVTVWGAEPQPEEVQVHLPFVIREAM